MSQLRRRLGLGRDWSRVMSALQSVISIYDRANKLMSLGSDVRIREEGITMALRNEKLILDAGCGPGKMSELIFLKTGVEEIVLADPLPLMLAMAGRKLMGKKILRVSGLFEHMPFRNHSFDAVVCGFSLRDSIDFEGAIKELSRVVRRNGKLLIVDLGKPDNPLLKTIIGLYWRLFVPLINRLAFGELGRFYSELYTTYRRYPTNREVKKLLLSYFEKVYVLKRMLGGALIIIATKRKPLSN